MNDDLAYRLHRLKELKAASNEACKLAASRKGDFFSDPINFAQLRCVQAAYSMNSDEDYWSEVTIEGASPDATKLAAFIQKHLEDNGFPDILVRTEW